VPGGAAGGPNSEHMGRPLLGELGGDGLGHCRYWGAQN
jgi:hypothetical protein